MGFLVTLQRSQNDPLKDYETDDFVNVIFNTFYVAPEDPFSLHQKSHILTRERDKKLFLYKVSQ